MWFLIPVIIVLGCISYQDFKYRAVSWGLFPLGFILGIVFLLPEYHWKIIAFNFCVNLCIVGIQMLLLTIFFALKDKKIAFIAGRYMGAGDWLFFILLCLFFSPVNFILFLIASLLLILIFFGLFQIIKRTKQIPLAGALSLLFIIALGLGKFTDSFDLYTDLPVAEYLSIYE